MGLLNGQIGGPDNGDMWNAYLWNYWTSTIQVNLICIDLKITWVLSSHIFSNMDPLMGYRLFFVSKVETYKTYTQIMRHVSCMDLISYLFLLQSVQLFANKNANSVFLSIPPCYTIVHCQDVLSRSNTPDRLLVRFVLDTIEPNKRNSVAWLIFLNIASAQSQVGYSKVSFVVSLSVRDKFSPVRVIAWSWITFIIGKCVIVDQVRLLLPHTNIAAGD